MSKLVTARRMAVAGCAAAAAVGTMVLGGTAAHATGTMTVTAVSVHRLPSATANQLVTITGTNFSEAAISGVTLSNCTAGTYIVTSATTIAFKTDNTCTTTAASTVTVDPVTGSNVTSTPSNAKMALVFVAAPSLAANDGTHFPVVTANTAGMTTPVTTASSSGGTSVKVTSGTVGFVSSSAFPLSATIDGVKLTNVALVGTSGTAGNAFTATLPAVAADASPTLVVTSNGVSKTFSYAAASSSAAVANSFVFTIAGVSISASPAFGATKGGTVVVIKGSGFTSSTTVAFGATACPVVSGSVKATQLSCTAPAASAAGPVTVTTTTGSVTSVVSAGSTFTYVS